MLFLWILFSLCVHIPLLSSPSPVSQYHLLSNDHQLNIFNLLQHKLLFSPSPHSPKPLCPIVFYVSINGYCILALYAKILEVILDFFLPHLTSSPTANYVSLNLKYIHTFRIRLRLTSLLPLNQSFVISCLNYCMSSVTIIIGFCPCLLAVYSKISSQSIKM